MYRFWVDPTVVEDVRVHTFIRLTFRSCRPKRRGLGNHVSVQTKAINRVGEHSINQQFAKPHLEL